jgi:type I restriction enzyme S subunit
VALVVDCEHKTAPACGASDDAFGYSVGTPNIKDGRIDYAGAKKVSRETFESWSRRAVLGEGDLILAREAPVGQVARVDPTKPTCLGQRTVLVRANQDLVTSGFLHSWLLAPEAQSWMEARSAGSTVAHLNVADVREIPVRVPSIEEQQRIAAVLGALDELIDTNVDMHANVVRLFDACWERAAATATSIRPFGEFAAVRSESAAQGGSDEIYLALEHFAEGGGGLRGLGRASDATSVKRRFAAGDVLYGKLRPYFRKVDRPNFGGVCTTEIWPLRPLAQTPPEFLEWFVRRQAFTDHAMAGSTGTKMPRAVWEHVARMPTPLLPEDVLAETAGITRPLWELRWTLQEEMDELRNTRNELLPLLMSGRVRVEEVAA